MFSRLRLTVTLIALIGLVHTTRVSAQDGLPRNAAVQTDQKTLIQDTESQAALFDKFKRLMSGAKLTGMFTIDGKPLSNLEAESYEIKGVEKAEEGDAWIITARIKYGKRDLEIPVPLDVKWAGTTPVLTLDNLTLPGFGTFSARVVLHRDKYAGTWQHDDVGGHLFGMIELGSNP
ncbi:MAG: hypothetical protein KDB03_14760 [Planctomycetales bacterium]|nr:hypothetical protein [Planctomycetales bacterium]